MEINLDELDNITQTKYKEFKEKVEELLETYQQTDKERFNLVKSKIKQANGNWDTTINLTSKTSRVNVDISQLLAYEYCLASERISKGKVPFESMLDKLFTGIQKFRIGNPIPGKDDECLYGESFDDPTAIPITSKLYRMVTHTEAQHLNYFKDDIFTGAVFIFEKGTIKGFAKDENGKPVDMGINGINFRDLNGDQSLLTNLRQTVFHEWNHNSEKEFIDPTKDYIAYEYQSKDGKRYRNYERINSYVTAENIANIQEPPYIITEQRDSQGNRKKYFQDNNGNLRPLSEVKFELQKKQLEREYCLSTGLTTIEVKPNGKTKKHNQITEGFVEATARAMILAIAPDTHDIAEGRYYEKVEIARRVISSRDNSIGEMGITYADMLMHSSILKADLETRTVVLPDGSKTDGLHYIGDRANKVHERKTPKRELERRMPQIAKQLGIDMRRDKQTLKAFLEMNLFGKNNITVQEQEVVKKLLMSGKTPNETYVDNIIAELISYIDEENKFLDGIPKQLGYLDRTIESQKPIKELVQESIKGVPDFTVLDEIEQVETRQERAITIQQGIQEKTQDK